MMNWYSSPEFVAWHSPPAVSYNTKNCAFVFGPKCSWLTQVVPTALCSKHVLFCDGEVGDVALQIKLHTCKRSVWIKNLSSVFTLQKQVHGRTHRLDLQNTDSDRSLCNSSLLFVFGKPYSELVGHRAQQWEAEMLNAALWKTESTDQLKIVPWPVLMLLSPGIM